MPHSFVISWRKINTGFSCIIFSTVFIFFIFSCTNATHKEQTAIVPTFDSVPAKKQKATYSAIDVAVVESIPKKLRANIEALKTKYNVFISFDGSCSACVAEFLGQLKKLRSKKANMAAKYLFIAFAQDSYLVEYYMAQLGLTLRPNEFLIIDKGQVFQKTNSFIEEFNINFVLSNRDYKILALGSPLESEEIRSVYAGKGLL